MVDHTLKIREDLELGPMTMTTKLVICLVGCSKRSSTEMKLRIETRRRSQPSSRRMITMPRNQVKSDKSHLTHLKLKVMSSVDKSAIEDIQKKVLI